MHPTLSAALIVLNEAARLPALLARLHWVDEIVVIDGGSTDETVAISQRYTDRVWVQPFVDYASQRNEAIRRCRGDWVFSIDADELAGDGFADEVRRVMGAAQGPCAFRVPIRSKIFGRRFRYSGTQDDQPIRLFRRESARWTGNVHEVLEVDGAVGRLRVTLEHDTLPDLHAFLTKMDRYTTLEARARLQRGVRWRRWNVVWQPARELFRRLIWKRGVLDGPAGWLFCGLSGLSALVAHLKHRELLVRSGAAPDTVRRHEASPLSGTVGACRPIIDSTAAS